jgi:hypothetical protein
MVWSLSFLVSRILAGVTPFRTPFTKIVAPAGEDVTGMICSLLRVSVAQFGESRTLVRVRMIKKRFALAILIVGLPYASVFCE